jgi:hypothetical protein
MNSTVNQETRNDKPAPYWKSLAARASAEMDSEKLMNLVAELNSVLDEELRNRRVFSQKSVIRFIPQ